VNRHLRLPLATLGLALALTSCAPKPNEDPYRTAKVTRGALTESVSATGALEALKTVEIGSQVSGPVAEVLVDFNSRVTAGQTLAILDQTPFLARLAQAQADLAAQEANLGVSQAQIVQARADRAAAVADAQRYGTLVEKGFASQQLAQTRAAAGTRAEASVSVANAQIQAQRARIAQSRASVSTVQVDLRRTIIRSPVDGVVVERSIDPGQTVAASFNSPVLFRIAQDLSQVRVKINVDEADIGRVREGQTVRFSVDAFGDEKFTGIVSQVRKQGQTAQGVVTYVVMADAANPNEKLLPGMTANAEIVVAEQANALRIPAAALRWTPPSERGSSNTNRSIVPGIPAASGAQQQAGRPQGAASGGQGGGPGRMLERLTTELKLDAKQQEQAREIFAKAREQAMSAGPPAAGMTQEQRRAAFAGMRAQMLKSIEPILRPDQKALLATMVAGPPPQGRRGTPATVYVLREGKPQAVAVMIGGTDGAYAEMLSGSLKADDELVTGGGPRARVQIGGGPPGSGGPRP
jgi:HlyD family secretion protein